MSVSSGCGAGRGGSLPIHHAANCGKDISIFRTVFEAGMQHYPTKIGFLFHKDEHGRTSYQVACKKYGNEQVEEILDGVALNTTTTATTTKEQHDIVVKSLMFAATEEIVHLDGLYILLRREPSVRIARKVPLKPSFVLNSEWKTTTLIPKMNKEYCFVSFDGFIRTKRGVDPGQWQPADTSNKS